MLNVERYKRFHVKWLEISGYYGKIQRDYIHMNKYVQIEFLS